MKEKGSKWHVHFNGTSILLKKKGLNQTIMDIWMGFSLKCLIFIKMEKLRAPSQPILPTHIYCMLYAALFSLIQSWHWTNLIDIHSQPSCGSRFLKRRGAPIWKFQHNETWDGFNIKNIFGLKKGGVHSFVSTLNLPLKPNVGRLTNLLLTT